MFDNRLLPAAVSGAVGGSLGSVLTCFSVVLVVVDLRVVLLLLQLLLLLRRIVFFSFILVITTHFCKQKQVTYAYCKIFMIIEVLGGSEV